MSCIFRGLLLLTLLPLILTGKTQEYSIGIVSKKSDRKLDAVNIFNDIFLTTDSDLKIGGSDIYLSEKYSEMTVRDIAAQGSLDAIDNLRKSKANIAIIRGDVIAARKHSLFGFDPYEDYAIVCSSGDSLLYLISKKPITSIIDLRSMRISTGLSSNIAQLYLDNITKNSGIKLDITYKSIDLDHSLYALDNDEIDAIFLFGPADYVKKIQKAKFILNSLPDDFFSNLTLKQGLNRESFMAGDKYIRTFSVPNFIIAPKNTLDTKIETKIEAMVSAFECYRTIQNIDAYYGDIHEMVKASISNIHKRIEDENALSVALVGTQKVDNGRKYVIEFSNASSTDMNITFEGFETKAFDKSPIKPRHLIEILPEGIIEIKAKSHKSVSYVYQNPFLQEIRKKKIRVIYKNLTVENSKIEFSLTIGD